MRPNAANGPCQRGGPFAPEEGAHEFGRTHRALMEGPGHP